MTNCEPAQATEPARSAQRTPGDPLPEIMSIQHLAEFLGVPLSTVYKWRYRGEGPRAIKIGGHVRYRRSEVQHWLAEHEEPLRDH